MKSLPLFIVCAGLVIVPFGAHAKEFEVSQKDKEFSPKALTVKAGDAISFKNNDPFSHNVFSLSDAKTFDLGSYPQGQSRKIIFDKPGTIEVECAIHPDMKINIEVQK
jgi:plastocyanin